MLAPERGRDGCIRSLDAPTLPSLSRITSWYSNFKTLMLAPELDSSLLLRLFYQSFVVARQNAHVFSEHPYPRKGKTSTVTPAKPGDYLFYLSSKLS
jgi:hypothetical protein